MSDPIVSVCMITYNHEKYISQAIEGVLKQETNFRIELIIGEDCSKDDTYLICKEYSERYPEIIRVLATERNMGMMPNFIRTLQACNGKYVALCEGDDYWTDPLKLQKQVNFLESKLNFSSCFHDCAIYRENDSTLEHNSSRANNYKIIIFSTEHLIKDWFINTCTVMFRKASLIIPLGFHDFLIDRLLLQLISLSGPIMYLKEEMAVYRIHNEGISRTKYTRSDIEKIRLRWDIFNAYTNQNYDLLIKQAKRRLSFEYSVNNKDSDLRRTIQLIVKNLDIIYIINYQSMPKSVVYLIKLLYGKFRGKYHVAFKLDKRK